MRELDRELLEMSRKPIAKSPKKEPIGEAPRKEESPVVGSEDD
jgi:hypothetical protein